MHKKIPSCNRFKWLSFTLLIAMLMLIASACEWLPEEEEPLPPPLVEPAQVDRETSPVERGEIVQRVTGNANFYTTEVYDLYFEEAGGRMEVNHVRSGEQVEQGDLLVELQVGDLEFDIEQTRLDLRQAEIRVNNLKEHEAPDSEIELADIDRQKVQMRLNRMQNQLESSQIRSPINGVVTYINEKRQGDFIDAYETLVQVADPSELNLVYTASNSNEINEVDDGMPVRIEFNNVEYDGVVVQTPRNMPQNLPQEEEERFSRSLVIEMEDMPDDVSSGDFANIEVITKRSEDALIIPRGALRTYLGRNYVQVMDGDSIREVDVETGIETSRFVEIVEGLEESDEVIMR